MAGEAKVTTDHDTIKRWVQERGGKPASIRETRKQGEGAGILRINFPGYSGEEVLESISWNDFFSKFEREHLAFMYQEHTHSGEPSRFAKFISRDEAVGQGPTRPA